MALGWTASDRHGGGSADRWTGWSSPYLLLYPLPKIAFLPVFIAFGIGDASNHLMP